ncbi:hypothetical protein B0H17DRAFT_1207823 [Mycena rosella]|uniref:Uncharacterized protein n=1 Tax=Mycena rosella TaxID=1033263 RepID=A0AAD7D5Q6_MYCRO|nr:hypothetical protein B0H17DRAFT_1207823 [Mycena rosella]
MRVNDTATSASVRVDAAPVRVSARLSRHFYQTPSLVRLAPKPCVPPKPTLAIAESANEVVWGLKGRVQASMSSIPAKAPASSSASKPGEQLVFGQAKLRDLIKKYQGQAAA